MGNNEGWLQPNGLLPNGLLPNVAARVTRRLDSERWLIAEERTAELIACIQPNQLSEQRRSAVAHYVQQLIMKCFSCQVFTFGSVPLKTYLPDGDIDLTAFSKNQNLKDTWANDVRDMLENEEKREHAEFHVKEVQYIQAEVKIIKCLVENIVVDISFNQLGGLCTLCFLEEVDHLINQNHLFKRSIILIKAWCYYESRILGAHHGLISTYALETLVLYIFHVFNNSFNGPLEVLYRFLEFFSNFDWENFSVSLWGPVAISQLPDVTAEPPRKDGGKLLLSKPFLDACGSIYAVYPGVQENQGQPFVSKHFNVIDPLRTNNNLGRSVNKGNFFRIRSAFAFGAKKLARLLECPKENLITEVNQFFMNTWDRHGSRHRPDAPGPDLRQLKPPNVEYVVGSNNSRSQSTRKKGVNDGLVEIGHVRLSDSVPNIHNALLENVPRASNSSGVHHIVNEKNYGNQAVSAEIIQKVLKPYYSLNYQDAESRHQFARTRSSPELTETTSEPSTRGRRSSKAVDIGKNHRITSRPDYNHKRKNMPSETFSAHQSLNASSNESSFFSHSLSQQSSDTSTAPNLPGALNNYAHDDGSQVSQDVLQEQQDFVNVMAASRAHGFPGSLSLPSAHIPVPLQPSIVGYAQRNLGGISLIDPAWGSGMQFPPGLVSSPLSHYFSGLGLGSSPEIIDSGNESSTLTESTQGDNDAALWPENDNASSGGLESVLSSRLDGSSGNSVRSQHQKLQNGRGNDIYASDRSANMRPFIVSEVNSSKLLKSAGDKRGSKTIPGGVPATSDKSRTSWQCENDMSAGVDQVDDKDWHVKSSRNGGPVSAVPPSLPYEAGSSGSDPMIPGPMVVGSGSRQITFYPTGPPVPFVTMLPLYNFPPDTGSSGGSPRQFDRDDGLLENGYTNLSEQRGMTSNFDASESLEQSDLFGSPSSMDIPVVEPRDELNVDILHSDFISHWQNLQYGRICQSPRNHPPIIYSPPFVVPPVYLQGHFPWDGPGRPSTANMSLFTQVMGCGSRILPVTPLQPGPSRPAGVYQRYGEEMPRYRGGTGTYLPNPKPVSFRDRQSANNRSHRGRDNYDRNDHGDTDRGWNINSKPRGSGQNRNKYDSRGQSDKRNSRSDRPGGPDNSADRIWDSYRHETFSSFPTQNVPFTSANPVESAGSVAYSMYPLQALNSNAVGSSPSGTGPSVPSVVMLYPYEHSIGYARSQDQPEFDSLGPVHFGSVNEATKMSDGGITPSLYEQRHGVFKGDSPAQSSPDQPSSPQLQRGI